MSLQLTLDNTTLMEAIIWRDLHPAAYQKMIESEGQALAAALDEADRLKVCGNCRHCEAHGLFCVEATLLGYDGARDEGWPNWYKDGSFNVHVLLGDPCHFTPSRWTPTTEAPE